MTQPPDPQKKKSWIDDMASRTAGLPSHHEDLKSKENKETADSSDNPWRIAGLGLQMAGTVGLMWWLGYGLDRHFGWGNKAAITMTVIAIVGSLYLILKEALKYNK